MATARAVLTAPRSLFPAAGGPGNASDVSSWETPEFAFAAAACTLGLGAPSSCTLSLIPPPGYATDPGFNSFTDIMEFFTTVSAVRVSPDAAAEPLGRTLCALAAHARRGTAGRALPPLCRLPFVNLGGPRT